MRRLPIGTSLLAALALDCGDPSTSVAPTDEPTPRALIAGTAAGDRYGNVGAMVGRVDASSPWVAACTGTLVAPDLVLTAAHCPFLGPIFEGFTEFGVSFDPQFGPTSPVVPVTQVYVHPDFSFGFPFPSPGNPLDFFDLALLRLADEVDRVPAALPPPGLFNHMARSSGPLTIVGYGLPRADASFAERGTRRVGSVTLGEVDGPVFFTVPDPALSCTGDSGGPALVGPAGSNRGARGATMILGVGQSGDCATFNGYYRLDTPQARRFLGQYLPLPGR